MNEATTIRDYLPGVEGRPGDEGAILEAHRRCYGETDPGYEPFSLARWRWQYPGNPAGARIKLALGEQGEVLAQYAGQSRYVQVGDQRLRSSHCADSFVLPERRGLSKLGLFVRTGHDFARDFGGAGEEDDRWMWGFPVASAQRIGERSLGYTTVRAQVALVLEPGCGVHVAAPAQVVAGIGPEFDTFFAKRAAHHVALGVRDAAYLRWRYTQHPEAEYCLHEARDDDGVLSGYCVGREVLFEGTRVWMICDWLASPCAWAALIAAAVVRAQGLAIVLILPPWCVDFRGLQALGLRVRPTSLLMVGRSYDRRFDHRFWSLNWYYTLGDSDLV